MTRIKHLLVVALLLALSACGSTDGETSGGDGPAESSGGDTSGERIDIGADEALTWGTGEYGVVLAHGAAFDAASWEEQATAIADQGATVIAVENIDPEAIGAAVQQLKDEGIAEVALVGGSAGADAILRLLSDQPDIADQLITLAVNTEVDGIGEQPKLFIVSEDDPSADASVALAENADGNDNQLEVLPGSAHAQNIFDTDQGDVALQLILDRLAQ
ncbi:hypothetical protein GCM10027020_15000 [Nocardioides salsibiostraticola]